MQLNTHAPTAIRRIHFSMNMLSRRMKDQNICSEGWPPAPGVKYAARERQASTYLLDVCPGLLQFHRDFLSLFISMAKKAEAFFNRSLSLCNCRTCFSSSCIRLCSDVIAVAMGGSPLTYPRYCRNQRCNVERPILIVSAVWVTGYLCCKTKLTHSCLNSWVNFFLRILTSLALLIISLTKCPK